MALFYSSGTDVRCSLEQLHQVPTPSAFSRGPSHYPVPFGDYADLVIKQLDNIGFGISEQEYAVTKDGERFFGAIEVEPHGIDKDLIPEDYRFLVGLRGSHDMSITRGLTLGNIITVCSNLQFSGDIGTVDTKQSTNIWDRLPGMVANSIKCLPSLIEKQNDKFKAYKNFVFTNPRAGDAALVEIYRRNGLSSHQLGVAINEWDKPSYKEHDKFGNSAWKLLNATTEALKPTGNNVNHFTVEKRSQVAIDFIDNNILDLREVA